ncbi:hypothetical protein Tco_0502610 [Tanacetum coccineum]
MENLSQKHGFVSRTYYKKSLIMASTFGSKALLEDLALYDNKSWNNLRDFAKPVKAIALPQDVSTTSDRRLIELENQVQCLMKAHLAPKQPTQVNKSLPHVRSAVVLTTLSIAWKIPNKPSLNMHPRVPMKQEVSVPPSSNTELICTKEEDGEVMFIEIIPKDDDSLMEEPKTEGQEVEYFDIFPTRSELTYHKYLMCGPIPSIFLQNPIIIEGCPSNLKIPCNIRHVHVEKAYIDLNSPLNIMTRMMYN